MIFTTADVTHRRGVRWLVELVVIGAGPLDRGPVSPPPGGDLRFRTDAATVGELVALVQAETDHLADETGNEVATLWTLDGDPAAWIALVDREGVDMGARDHETIVGTVPPR